MEWLLTNPQIISTFSSLGFLKDDVYEISPNALAILEEINLKLIYEDQTLRTFRRAIGLGQHVKADLIPLLINAKDSEIVDAVIRILVNLTVPVECLFCVDIMYRTEVGRSTIFELNKLLITSKEAFADVKSTKSILNRIKSILDGESKKLAISQCDSINNCLLLLRNILHIPENSLTGPHSSSINNTPGTNGVQTSLQNTILWNLFIQSIDKTLIFLMSCPQRAHWVVTMVQLIALMYKDQHVGTLQKLLNIWFEASLSESSEDNESNTTPPNKGSGDSSPMLTSSDPTSDSSDNGGGNNKENSEERRQTNLNKETEATLQEVSRKGHKYQNAIMRVPPTIKEEHQKLTQEPQNANSQVNFIKKHHSSEKRYISTTSSDSITQRIEPENTSQDKFISPSPKSKIRIVKNISLPNSSKKSPHSGILCNGKCPAQKRECPSSTSELSDCGYGTQVENQESISTSSNEDDSPHQKPVHQKPHCNQKQRPKQHLNVSPLEKKEWRRKKLVKRSKSNIINMKCLIQHTPSDEDISHILKEFTVDFLLKGYGYLVQELHTQLLEDMKFPMDTSHFFWLVTYFLKFASQLELDLEHIHSVLNYEVLSYLTFEGVMLSEQLELTSREEGGDLKPFLRRIHLVVTAIREFLQALETYKKITHLTQDDRVYLKNLQLQVCATDDLRSLFLLLIRKFNPMWNSKQYLQEIIVTNHDLLVLLDNVTKSEDKSLINFNITEHIPQFAQIEIMHHYALLLDDFRENGEFVNDCVFTMMHHIGADLGFIQLLFQPLVLKTFSKIWESEFEVCDDWSDLIEYVIHRFMNSSRNNAFVVSCGSLTEMTKEHNMEHSDCTWTQEEKDILYWNYVQSKKSKDIVGRIRQLYKENGNSDKSRITIIQQLLQQLFQYYKIFKLKYKFSNSNFNTLFKNNETFCKFMETLQKMFALQKDVVTLVEYDDLMTLEDSDYQKNPLKRQLSNSTSESGIDLKDSIATTVSNASKNQSMDNIQYLKTLLVKEGKTSILIWLQRILLECCYVKLSIDYGKIDLSQCTNEDGNIKIRVMESIPYHCILRKKSIPLVPWNSDQTTTMTYKPFVMLLHKLGFHLPADSGSIYARIPEFWTADIMYNVAQKLGNINKNLVKFDINLLHNVVQGQHSETVIKNEDIKCIDSDKIQQQFTVPTVKYSNSIIRYTPKPIAAPSVPNWLQLVMKSKCNVSTCNNSNNNLNNNNNHNSNNNINNTNNPNNNESTTNTISSLKILEAIAEIENFHDTILEEKEEELKNEEVENNEKEQKQTNHVKEDEEDIKEKNVKELEEEGKYNVEEVNIHLIRKQYPRSVISDSNNTLNSLNNAVNQAFNELKSDTSSFIIPFKRTRNPLLQQQSSEDDSLMKSIDENHDDSSGYQTRRGSQMDTEFNSIVASIIDTEFLNKYFIELLP